jgi:pyruvate dehydrogenase E2 component (dihydrolipoamide acetyltransferase)
MATEVRLPDLGEGVASARLVAWLKREGDTVRAGEPIAELETDKTSMELEAPGSGVLQKICVGAGGQDVSIETLLAVIAEGAAGAEERSPMAAAVARRADTAPLAVAADAGTGGVPAHARVVDDARATPLARRMAQVAGIALTDIPGSGLGGRISKTDVETILRQRRGTPSPADAFEVQPLSNVQRITAERLLQAKQTIPHFYLHVDCHVDQLFEMRRALSARQRDLKLSVTVFVIRAAALALARVPQANSSWSNGTLRLYESVDIAVAVDTPAGLVTPIIRGAGSKSLAAIARELEALSVRARAGRLLPADYHGGTFTISNLGMYGVTSLYPIVNPPQSAILGVGAIERRPVVRGDDIVAGRVMACTLSADHRSIDGATGARFLDEFRRQIEDVVMMVL